MEYKNILVVLRKDNKDLLNWIEDEIVDKKHIFTFWDPKDLFELEKNLLVSDLVINFLNNDDKDFETTQKRIEDLKIPFFGNTFLFNRIFKQKKTFKEIILKLGLNTPIFEKINSRSSNDIFLNFPQPSRIFSKENNYFSGKLENMVDIKNILDNIENKDDLFIEEFIDGDDIYVFVYKDIFENITYLVARKINNRFSVLNDNEKKEVIGLLDSIDSEFNYKDFMLFHLLKNKKRGIYFLHNFISNYDLFEKKEILEGIFEMNHLDFPKKLFEKDLF